MVDLRIQPGATTPIYQQIVDQVSRAVAAGAARAGEALPSVRALAEELVVNPNTVVRAYQELAREGLVEARHGKGFFIAERRAVHARGERERRLDAALTRLVSDAAILGITDDDLLEALARKLRAGRGGRRSDA